MNTGQKALQSNLNRTFAFAWATNSPSRKLNMEWAVKVHRCNCGRAITNVLEFDYMEATGKCSMCDEFIGGTL